MTTKVQAQNIDLRRNLMSENTQAAFTEFNNSGAAPSEENTKNWIGHKFKNEFIQEKKHRSTGFAALYPSKKPTQAKQDLLSQLIRSNLRLSFRVSKSFTLILSYL